MKRLILAISIVLVLGLAAAGIAYNRNAVAETAMSCRCCAGDSCPMKKDAAAKEGASCCDDGCCKDGSCAMKKEGAESAGHMPENCPMMKDKTGHASHATMTAEEHQAMNADGESCCCSCCKDKQAA
jgi:hypothetical protein